MYDYKVIFKNAAGGTMITVFGAADSPTTFALAADLGSQQMMLERVLSGAIPRDPVETISVECTEGKKDFTRPEFINLVISGPRLVP